MPTSQPSIPLDLHSLSLTAMLTTEQVGELGMFGRAATLTHNRCVGRPGPRFLKIGARIFYRASDLIAYLADVEAASTREQEARQSRFLARRRGGKAA